MYRIDVKRGARKDLESLPPALRRRVSAAIDQLAQEPRPPSSIKLAGLGMYRIRVGDYCVIYDVDDPAQAIIILRIRHRREAYRP
jgi:mRNA interferase RelE/StbE